MGVKSYALRRNGRMGMKNSDLLIISCLRQDARMKLTDMSKVTKIPVSTLFDKIKIYEGGVIKKHTALVRFDKLGYQAKALIAFSTAPQNKQKLLELLDKNRNVNSLHKINNGWDYMAEVVFPGVKEVEEFIEKIEGMIRLKGRKVFYIIDEIKKESFLSNPGTVGLIA